METEEERIAREAEEAAEAAKKAAGETKPEDKPEDKAPETVSKADFDKAQTELERLRKAEKDREDANKTETEREKAAREEAEEKANKSELKVHRLSVLQGVRDAGSELKLDLDMDAVRDLYDAGKFKDVKVDDNGDAKGLNDFLKQLAKDKPYIVKTGKTEAPDINATKRGKAPVDRDESGNITPEREAALAKRFNIKK